MTDTQTLITKLYADFNARDITACLALMTDDVEWPKASEGGRVTGKEEVRAYWQRQWAEFNPHVEPVQIATGVNPIAVTVHQVVKGLDGTVLFDGTVLHRYTMRDGLVARMDLGDEGASGEQTSAFRRE